MKSKKIKYEKRETPQEVWKRLEREYNKIFDSFKYFDEPNKVMFINILIGEAIKHSEISPLNCIGLLAQIQDDISAFVRQNLSIPITTQTTYSKPTYLN